MFVILFFEPLPLLLSKNIHVLVKPKLELSCWFHEKLYMSLPGVSHKEMLIFVQKQLDLNVELEKMRSI